MSIGQMCRKILGPKYFKHVGKIYRRFFVDLEAVASALPAIPAGGHLLDVGGGDGELINHIVTRFPNIKITMIDIAPKIGNFIDPNFKSKVTILPGVSMADYKIKYLSENGPIDYILISDVLHHVMPADRAVFFCDLAALVNANTKIIIKDIEPGYLKSHLSYWADKYISGDKTVSLIGRDVVVTSLRKIFPQINYYETDLLQKNKPNYCLVFSSGKK